MADLVITPANVAFVAGGGFDASHNAGVNITQAQSVYLAAGVWQLAKADTAVHSGVGAIVGVSLGNALIGQPLPVMLPNPGQKSQINLGATLVVGKEYVISGANAGGIAPVTDLVTNNWITSLGRAISTTVLEMASSFIYNLQSP